jgi:hypothetical protein
MARMQASWTTSSGFGIVSCQPAREVVRRVQVRKDSVVEPW